MKREYVKPFLAVESFQLDAAIAGACSDIGAFPINFQVNSCRLDDGDDGVIDFIFGQACDADIVNTPDMCYHAFAANLQYLTS